VNGLPKHDGGKRRGGGGGFLDHPEGAFAKAKKRWREGIKGYSWREGKEGESPIARRGEKLTHSISF